MCILLAFFEFEKLLELKLVSKTWRKYILQFWPHYYKIHKLELYYSEKKNPIISNFKLFYFSISREDYSNAVNNLLHIC